MSVVEHSHVVSDIEQFNVVCYKEQSLAVSDVEHSHEVFYKEQLLSHSNVEILMHYLM